MKVGELTSFGHNVADSLASGICIMAGIYSVDIYREAASSIEGHIIVDFKTGSTSGSPVSPDLKHAIHRFSELLPDLAKKHGLDPSDIKVLTARFGTDPVLRTIFEGGRKLGVKLGAAFADNEIQLPLGDQLLVHAVEFLRDKRRVR
ncbi:MAG TPA: hypothetical protein VJU59_22520, partial [Paraburkholderia sp.]|uniref:hypothetical protein n=1 Tax=Paraburkholderia sp. TaxID=1926495 RepID=UPI002B478516